MAPKRSRVAATATGPNTPQKRAKIATPETREALLLKLLGNRDEIPKPCKEIFQIALPHCIGIVEGERHRFQNQMLDYVTACIADIERQKQSAITEAEARHVSTEAEKDAFASELERQRSATASKKAECDEKNKSVDEASDEVETAKNAVANAQKDEEAFAGKKAALLTEQESFAKVLAEVFQPLKDGSIPSNEWRRRNKLIAELQKQQERVGFETSLCDALAATLKLKPDLRESFAKTALEYAGSCFAQHSEKLEQSIQGLDAEAVALKDAVAAAEATLAENKNALEIGKKEWDDMQNEWVELEGKCEEANTKLKTLEQNTLEASEEIKSCKDEMMHFLEIPALLAKLKDPSEGTAAVEAAPTDLPEVDAAPEESASTA